RARAPSALDRRLPETPRHRVALAVERVAHAEDRTRRHPAAQDRPLQRADLDVVPGPVAREIEIVEGAGLGRQAMLHAAGEGRDVQLGEAGVAAVVLSLEAGLPLDWDRRRQELPAHATRLVEQPRQQVPDRLAQPAQALL